MSESNPVLFVEINDTKFVFVAGIYTDQNFKILEKFLSYNRSILKNKFININEAENDIKKGLAIIEKKLNYVFKEVNVVINCLNYSCLNISSFKKLNGSQILKENISYILNSLKTLVTENEKNKTIIHIFNSKSLLDGIQTENLPIGLFGDFYSHELTFLMMENNDLKNLKKIFSKNNLIIKKILIKDFVSGTEMINEKKIESFFDIKIHKNFSSIVYFDNSSLKYFEKFNFGSEIILQDILKVCSITKETLEIILKDKIFENSEISDNEILEEKYFTQNNFRKIRKRLIYDIANARIEELVNIIFYRNINFKDFINRKNKVFFLIDDKKIFNNFSYIFKSYFRENFEFLNLRLDLKSEHFESAANLSSYGWKKEAIPISQTKNSLISRIFQSLFN